MRVLRRIAILGVLMLGLAAALPAAALAQSTQDTILAELRQQGYSDISVSRTLLGRTRIVAESPAFHREIVFNPWSGTILRDYWRRKFAGTQNPQILDATGNDNGTTSSGGAAATTGSGSDDQSESQTEDNHEDSSGTETESHDD